MAKNLIPVIADCLGVRIGENFKIVNRSNFTYQFTEKELIEFDDRQPEIPFGIPAPIKISALGNIEIIRFPFKPKKGDEFWSYAGFNFEPVFGTWQGDYDDFVALNAGCVFRTKEDAIAARPAKYKELTGKEWEE